MDPITHSPNQTLNEFERKETHVRDLVLKPRYGGHHRKQGTKKRLSFADYRFYDSGRGVGGPEKKM